MSSRQTLYSAVAAATVVLGCQRATEPGTAVPAPAPVIARASAPAAKGPSASERVASLLSEFNQNSKLAAAGKALDLVDEIQTNVLRPWSRAWTAQDAAAFHGQLAPSASLPAWGSTARTAKRERDGLREFAWKLPSSAADETAQYLSAFSKIENVELAVASFDSTATTATLGLHFDLRGLTRDHVRRNDRGLLTAELSKTAEGWRLAKVSAPALESVEALPKRRPAFEDVTASLGLDKIPVTERSEAIRRGGYALATADFNGDGKTDLLIGNYGPVKLFQNTGHGFEDVTASSGLKGETLVKSAAFADLDNDGRKDLVLVRFIDTPHQEASTQLADVVLYHNLGGGKFEFKGGLPRRGGPRDNETAENGSRKQQYDRAMPIAIADFDGNGTLDVYVGFPGARDFTNDLHKDAQQAYSLGLAKQGLWLNNGQWRFSELDAWSASKDAETEHPFPHSALVADLDNDGRPELMVVDDSGGVSPIYRLGNDKLFHEESARMGVRVPGWNMAASASDFNGDGFNDLVTTKVEFASDEWLPAWRAKHEPGYQAVPQQAGLMLFQNHGGTFSDVTAQAGLGYAGHGLAGAEWIDYNNDGLLDLYVANGLWTGGDQDAEKLFEKVLLTRAERGAGQTDAAMSQPGEQGTPNPMLSILREFKGSLSNPTGPAVSEQPTLSLGGGQRHRLFRNNGDGSFTEVGYLENADRTEDGYVMAVADFDNDGHPDLVLRNCDPAPGRKAAPVVMLHNTHSSAPAVVVSLAGTKDNVNAVGAQLVGWIGSKRLAREIHSVAGATQSDTVAFFGLGGASRLDRLEVRWPSGRIEQFGPLNAGNVVLHEGEGREIRASLDVSPKGLPN